MIKRQPSTIIIFTADELATLKKIAEFDCEGINCSECECAYEKLSHSRFCFKNECRVILHQLDDNRR